MSRTLMPCACSEMIMSSRPSAIRPAGLGTSSGSNVPARSRGHGRPPGHAGLYRHGHGAVAVIPGAAAAGPLVPLIAEVRGQLGLQRPLQHRPTSSPSIEPSPVSPGPASSQAASPVLSATAPLPASTAPVSAFPLFTDLSSISPIHGCPHPSLDYPPLRRWSISSASCGITVNRSPITPKSASSKIGASGSLLTATIVFEVCIPARCWMAPDMPTAR
jgi:hypothetical protein